MLIFTVIKNEFKVFCKDKVSLGVYLCLTLFFIWVFIQIFSPYHFEKRYSEPIELGLVNKDNTAFSKMITYQFATTDGVKDFLKFHDTSAEQALAKLQKNELAGIILLPEGFVDSIYWGENKPFVFIGNSSQRVKADLIKYQLHSACNLITAGQSGVITVWHFAKRGGANQVLLDKLYNETVYKFTLSSMGRGRVYASETLSSIPRVNPAEYFTAALLVVFSAFLGIKQTKTLVVEKEAGIFGRLKAAQVGAWQIILGKLCANLLIIMGQLLFILLLTHYAFQNYLGNSILDLLIIAGATALCISAWAIFVASISSSVQTADLLGYLGTLFLAIIGGNIYPMVALPEYIKSLHGLSFTKYAMEGFLKLFAGSPTVSLYHELGFLLCFSCVLVLCAVLTMELEWRKS